MSHTDFNGSQIGHISESNNGGFLNNTPSKFGTPSKYGTQVTTTDQKCLLPVMISQIKEAPIPDGDETFKIDNKETTNVTLVGNITKVNIESITTTLTIQDKTGEMDVKIWQSDDNNNQTDPQLLQENNVIRIVGRIKVFRGIVSLQCYRVIGIEDSDEIELHELESKYAHLMNTKNIIEQPFWVTNNKNNSSNNNNNNNNKENNNSFNTFDTFNNNNNNRINNSSINNNSINNNNNNSMDIDTEHEEAVANLNDLEKKIYFTVKSNNSIEEGTHIDILIDTYGKTHNINEIRDSLDNLTNEGILYTTLDEEHFKTTN